MLHALSHPSSFESMGNMTSSRSAAIRLVAGHHPAAPLTPTSTNQPRIYQQVAIKCPIDPMACSRVYHPKTTRRTTLQTDGDIWNGT